MKVQTSTEFTRMMMLQRMSRETRQAMDRASYEMTSGLKADKYKATGGNLARLFSIERMLERNAVHTNTINLTEFRLDTMQLGLGRVLTAAEGLSVEILSVVGRGDLIGGKAQAERARQAFSEIAGVLNTSVNGQTLFAGTATDRAALVPAADILAQIEGRVAGLPVAAALAELDAYFAGAGAPNFLADAYNGTGDDPVPAEIGDDLRLAFNVRATDPAIVATLRGLATAALVSAGGPFDGAPLADQLAILGAAGDTLLAARGEVLDLRGRAGVAQEAVEMSKARRNAEREGLELARAKIVGADFFDSTAVFQAMQTQLENVFMVTARVSTLRFANFMR